MQVSCGNCQLSFDAPEGASGLVCPICRGPLLPKSADGAGPAAKAAAGLERRRSRRSDRDPERRPPLSARVEVLGASGDAAVGEVHLLAGGVSDALFGGKSTDDALDKLRAGKPTRFRVEQRLPNPADGDLTYPGAESGTLESRALAHLMRYCEDYVITCAIEVWRGNENARVEYKRGEISGVTVGGIDAPERLAEVMQWSSGNYRLVVPPFKLPAVAPKRPPAAAAAPAQGAGARAVGAGGPPRRARPRPSSACRPRRSSRPAPPPRPPRPRQPRGAAPRPAPTSAARSARRRDDRVATPPAAHRAASARARAATQRQRRRPRRPHARAPEQRHQDDLRRSRARRARAVSRQCDEAQRRRPRPRRAGRHAGTVRARPRRHAARRRSRKTGARKVSVPAPEVSARRAAAAATRRRRPRGDHRAAAEAPQRGAPAAVTRHETHEPAQPCRRRDRAEKPRSAKRETPIWTYVGVGVIFGARAARHLSARRPARPLSARAQRGRQTSTGARGSRTTSSGTGSSRGRSPRSWSSRWRAPASRPTR